MRKVICFCIIAVLTAGCGLTSGGAQTSDQGSPFTVKDSIEMTTFSDPYTRTPGAEAKEAPDGSGFLVVTTRGILRTNTLESSLWCYSRKRVEDFLNGRIKRAPRGRLLLRVVAVPTAEQTNSYGSVITDVEWSNDSRYVFALIEKKHGYLHFYRIDVITRHAQDLTPDADLDVRDASSAAGTVAFLRRVHVPNATPLSNLTSVVRTGQTLFHILFPEEFPNEGAVVEPWIMEVRWHGSSMRYPANPHLYYPIGAVSSFRPTVSPEGDFVLTAMPTAAILPEWRAYRSNATGTRFSSLSPSIERSGRAYDWPWQYALLNVETHRLHPLFNAPVAYTNGYGNALDASWSHSENFILLTNTYLPLRDGEAFQPETVKPCAIAVYTVKSAQVECIAETRFPEGAEHLMSAKFDSSKGRITSVWLRDGKESRTQYERVGSTWTPTTSREELEQPTRLRIYIHQGISVPPTLWAEVGGTAKEIWDPNPQIAGKRLGHAALYVWSDSSGHVWHGGLVTPPTPKPISGFPLVIQTHGFYNEHEFLVDGAYTTGFAAQPLASSGIAVLQMEDRPDKHSRPAIEEANDEVNGIESAIEHLKEDKLIDASKVGIIGFSRTQWYVEKALEHAPELYKAATVIDGVDQSYVSDMLFATDFTLAIRDHDDANGGTPFGPGLNKWFQNAAGFHLDRIDTPLRLEAIGQFSVLGEWETYSSLRQQHKPVDLVEIPNGQHILQKPRERYASEQGNVDWFRFWLQRYERPTREAAEQYKRWEHLRELEDVEKIPNTDASMPN